MSNESENVLVGLATLAIRQPNDALAQWMTDQYQAGSHSVKLSKGGSGNAGSTHLQLDPPAGITMQMFEDAIGALTPEYSFYHKLGANAVVGNFLQFEFRFKDPNSEAWVELTVVNQQTKTADITWAKETLDDADLVGFGGVAEDGSSFFDWDLGTTLASIITDIDASGSVDSCADWVLDRVRIELWEAEPERYAYVDTVVINGVAYAIEPGAAASVGLSLSSPYVDVGYTEDGVTLNYTVDTSDTEVEEETFPVARHIIKETLEIVCNMAESSLFNIDKAIAGSVLSGSKLTIGAGVLKEMSIKLTGVTPAGTVRSYEFPRVTATGAVGMSFRRAEKTIVPLTFQALKPSSGPVGTYVDNA